MAECSYNLSRGIAIADFILEDEHNTLKQAAEEFRISTRSARRDLNYLGAYAFSEDTFNEKDLKKRKELQKKYVKVQKQLRSNVGTGNKKKE